MKNIQKLLSLAIATVFITGISYIPVRAVETHDENIVKFTDVNAKGNSVQRYENFRNITNRHIGGSAALEGTIKIHDIQGASHRSPYEGKQVKDVRGIVTDIDNKGFYIQDSEVDNLDSTSEGIYVFTNSNTEVDKGDLVSVSGMVEEFAYKGGLSITEISGPSIETISKGNELPRSVALGKNGRKTPDKIIDNDGLSKFDIDEDGIDFYESLEGMRISVSNPRVVGYNEKFDELVVVSDASDINEATKAGGIRITENDFNPERLIIKINNYGNIDKSKIKVGDSFKGEITGVMSYSYGNYKVLQTEDLPEYNKSSFERETTKLVGDGSKLTVATFNLENFIENPTSTKDITRLKETAKSIVNNLKVPDILGVEEIQDNNGSKKDSVVDSSETLNKLISEIKALNSNVDYGYAFVNPIANSDGGEPGGNIRQAFLYRKDRGVTINNFKQGTSEEAIEVIGDGNNTSLSVNPGRVDPNNEAFIDSRKPLACEFSFKGNKVVVVANHFNSKGGDDKLFGSIQPPVLKSEVQRNKQAKVVNDFVTKLLNKNKKENVVVLGDLNDFEFSNPLKILKGDKLTDVVDMVDENERYTYNFEGNSQVLDHILVSNNLKTSVSADIVHINADFAEGDGRTTDHDPVIAQISLAGDKPDGPSSQKTITPTINSSIYEGDKVIKGKAEPNSKIIVKKGTTEIGSTVTKEDGTFEIKNLAFYENEVVSLTSILEGKTESDKLEVKVLKKTDVSTDIKIGDLIITEIYGAGGNSGSVFGRDFIEIYNASDKNIDLTGYKIVYSSEKGKDSGDVTSLNGVLKKGCCLLVLEDDNGKGTNTDVKENDKLRVMNVLDEKEQIEMSATSGKVRVLDNNNKIVIEQVSYIADTKNSYTRKADGTYMKAIPTPGVF